MKRVVPIALALAAAVLATGGWITHVLVSQRQQQGVADAARRFEREADHLASDVHEHLVAVLPTMQGIRGLVAGSDHVSAAEFRRYLDSSQRGELGEGVHLLGVVSRWPRQSQSAVERQVARERPGYRWRPLGEDRPATALPLRLGYPSAHERDWLGADLSTHADLAAAAEQALQGNLPVLSTAVTGPDGERRWWLLLPTEAEGRDRGTPDALIVATVSLDRIVSALRAVHEPSLDFGLVELTPGREPMQVAASRHARPSRWHAQRLMTVGQRLWRLEVSSSAAFEQGLDTEGPRLVAWAGALASVTLAALVGLITHLRISSRAEVRRLGKDLARLAAVAERTSNAVFLTDLHDRITWVNEGFCRMYGHPAPEALGRQPQDLLGGGGDDTDALRRLESARQQQTPCRVELVHRTRDGRTLWVELEQQPMLDELGRVSGFMAIAADLTSQKETALQLASVVRENQGLLNTIRQHSLLSVADADGRIIDVNEAFCERSQYGREELIGQSHRLLRSDHHPGPFWSAMWATISAGKPWRGQICNRAKDGSLYWVDSIIAPFRGHDGQISRYVSIRTDITAAKRAEQALRESGQFLERVGRIAGVGGWSLALTAGQGTALELRLSDTLQRQFGVQGRQGPGLRGLLRRLQPEGRRALIHACRRARRGEGGWDLELGLRTAGPLRWLRVVGELETDTGGGAWRLVGAVQDVTRQRELKDGLRRTNDTLRGVLENLPVGLAVFDAERRLGVRNQGFAPALRIAPDWLAQPGLRLEDIVREVGRIAGQPWETIEAQMARWAVHVRERQREVFEVERAGGTVLEVTSAPMPDGGMVLIYQDISERKAREAEIRRADVLLRTAIATLNEGFVLYDPDDRLLLCNEPYRQMFALTGDLIREGNTFEAIIRGGVARGQYPDAVGREEDWIRRRLALHREAAGETILKVDDGHWLRVVERRTPDGHTVGFRIDITELVEARQRAEQASQAKSLFLAAMSHEIRTPLNAVLGMLRLLRRTPLTMRQADYVMKTEGAARTLLALLNDLLDASKIEAGKMELDPQPFQPRRLLGDLEAMLTAQMTDERPLRLVVEGSPDLPEWLQGDAMRLMQVLLNLGANALKFTEAGEVRVSWRLVDLRDGRAQVQAEVRDTGIGIAPEHMERIFSGFSQAESSTARRYGGTGLGLTICRQLVQLMGGQLALESAPGQGSRFHFTIELPVAAPGAEDSAWRVLGEAGGPAPVRANGRQLQGLRLLLVEDNANNRQVATELLEDEGARVDCAEDGQVALDLLLGGQQTYDAVLMDIRMPVLDGLETTRRLRADPRHAHLPIIAMSANVSPADRAASLDAGLDEHIGKPFDLKQLLLTLQRWTGWVPPDDAGPSEGLPDAPPPAALALAERLGISLAPALDRVMGRRDVYRRLVRQFHDRLDDSCASLDTALDQGDVARLERELHSLKGLAGTLGAPALAAHAAELEAEAERVDAPALARLHGLLRDTAAALGQVGDALAQPDEPRPSPGEDSAWPPATPAGGARARALLAALRGQLEGFDMAATDTHAQLLQAFPGLPPAVHAPLEQAMAQLDFAQAAGLVRQLQDGLSAVPETATAKA